MTNEQKIWSFLMEKIGNPCGVAGLMGNLYAESALKPTNLQNSYEKSLGMTDESYTAAVDNGSYTNFVRDSAGYGLAQWTYHTRKAALLAYVKAAGASIGDVDAQLGFLWKELSESYSASVLSVLKSAKTIKEASDVVLTKFECPANQGSSVKAKRAEYGQTYYDKYAVSGSFISIQSDKITTGAQLAERAISVAKNYKTLYVMGCFGAPMTAANKSRYCDNHSYNRDPARQKMIKAASADTFGFDCVCLIKGLLWGWSGDKGKVYGGATYGSNGVPDIGADGMINVCNGISTDFSNIEIGEVVWMEGHIGIYVGNGLAVECTPAWENKVQITACNCSKNGYNRRNWTKHGKLPYISYTGSAENVKTADASAGSLPTENTTQKTVDELANEVIAGKWGNGDERKQRLTAAGYDYAAVQKRVNEILKGEAATQWTPAVGDIVNYKGTRHYTNAYAATGPICKGGKAKITQIYQLGKAKHPYHLIAVSGGGSTVYGWVDEGSFTKA